MKSWRGETDEKVDGWAGGRFGRGGECFDARGGRWRPKGTSLRKRGQRRGCCSPTRRVRGKEFYVSGWGEVGGVAVALRYARQTDTQFGRARGQRRDAAAWDWREWGAIFAAAVCGGIVWGGATAGYGEVLHHFAGRDWAREIVEAERRAAREISAVRLRRYGGGASRAAGGPGR